MGSVDFMRFVRQKFSPQGAADVTDDPMADANESNDESAEEESAEVDQPINPFLATGTETVEDMVEFLKTEHLECLRRAEVWDANQIQCTILDFLDNVRTAAGHELRVQWLLVTDGRNSIVASSSAGSFGCFTREATERRGGGFAEANKVVQCPKEFGHATTLEDQTQWSDFSFTFKSWLFFAEPAFEHDIRYIEENPTVPVIFQENPSGVASKERARKLYSILAGILKNRPLKVLRAVTEANGLEVWRQLHTLYVPKTKGRSLALLNALMQMPAFTKDRSCREQVQGMERLAEEYRKASGHEVNEDILLSTLIRVSPKHLQQHVQLTMSEQSSFAEVKERILAFERISSTWTKDRVLADAGIAPLGAVTSYATADSGGTMPMEVNLIKGKGKWKGKQQSDKGKTKGKHSFDKGKSKGKQFDKGKGKNTGKGDNNYKGSQKGNSGTKLDPNTCSYCGKYGHWQKDCLKKKADQQNKQVRVVEDVDQETMSCEVILDSGADTSALPLSFSGVGTPCPEPSTTFVDAQGSPLTIESTRLATVQFGDVVFREKFIVADVTTPLIALGHIIKAGWSLVQKDDGPCLVKGNHCIHVLYRNNSLCAKGSISMVCAVEPEDSIQAVRAVQPGIVLRTLSAGWNRLNPQMFAIKTVAPKHVDTTMAPSDELMWLRTTLVCREGSGWEVDEFCEAIADLPEGLETEFFFPQNVLEVITIAHKYAMPAENLTIAHKYAMPAENLGFYMPDYGFDVAKQSHEDAKQSHSDVKAPADVSIPDDAASEGCEQSIDADIPEEAPVDLAEGEPLAEDRVVLRGPDEAVVHIDGVALTIDSTLRALRAGCEALGLSKRGSKELCMKRMLDHIQTQTLLAAHSAEVRLKADAEREVRGQKIPKVPTQAEVDNHNLTHEPFRDWCELCTMYRARQDKHVPSTHEHSGHSVISYDFGYCARMPGEDDKQTCLVLKDRDTQLIHVIPTVQKGGKSLQYLVTEFARFIMATQHKEVALRSDLEPSNLAILDAVKKHVGDLVLLFTMSQCL
eukprot:s97_g15.t1